MAASIVFTCKYNLFSSEKQKIAIKSLAKTKPAPLIGLKFRCRFIRLGTEVMREGAEVACGGLADGCTDGCTDDCTDGFAGVLQAAGDG